jgi:hypothetical protein
MSMALPEKDIGRRVARTLGQLALGFGTLGFVLGIAETVRVRMTLSPAEQSDYVMSDGAFSAPLGDAALWCIALALALIVLALLASFGTVLVERLNRPQS